MKRKTKEEARKIRHLRIRERIKGTVTIPRLAIFRSKKHIYVQLIDDTKGHVLTGFSTLSKEFKETKKKSNNKEGAYQLGKIFAEKLLEKNIKKVVFDRGGFKYHGRVKALADGLREGGLEF